MWRRSTRPTCRKSSRKPPCPTAWSALSTPLGFALLRSRLRSARSASCGTWAPKSRARGRSGSPRTRSAGTLSWGRSGARLKKSVTAGSPYRRSARSLWVRPLPAASSGGPHCSSVAPPFSAETVTRYSRSAGSAGRTTRCSTSSSRATAQTKNSSSCTSTAGRSTCARKRARTSSRRTASYAKSPGRSTPPCSSTHRVRRRTPTPQRFRTGSCGPWSAPGSACPRGRRARGSSASLRTRGQR